MGLCGGEHVSHPSLEVLKFYGLEDKVLFVLVERGFHPGDVFAGSFFFFGCAVLGAGLVERGDIERGPRGFAFVVLRRVCGWESQVEVLFLQLTPVRAGTFLRLRHVGRVSHEFITSYAPVYHKFRGQSL